MNTPTTTVTLTAEQIERLRALVFRDIEYWGQALEKQAESAADHDEDRHDVGGYIREIGRDAEILDVIGWARPAYEDEMARRRAAAEVKNRKRNAGEAA